MKIGRTLFALAMVAGSTAALAGDDIVRVEKQVPNVLPTEINGMPYMNVFSNRSTPVSVYDNSTGTFFSTGSTPRWNTMDDLQFTAVAAGYTGQAEPILGCDGPLPNGNILTDQFAVGFVYNGGDSLGNPLPRVQMQVRFFDTDVWNTADDPVNNPALFIGGFNLNFLTLPAQTGNVIFTTALFSILNPDSSIHRYFFPNANVGVQYTFMKETVDGSGTFDIPATVYTAGFANGTATTNACGNVGPVVGGSAAIYMRDASGDGSFQQTEYRNFTQPTNANFWLQITGACAVDFDGDDFPTGDDFDAYVAAFEAGDISSDFDGDGFVTGDDFDRFVAAFEKGC